MAALLISDSVSPSIVSLSYVCCLILSSYDIPHDNDLLITTLYIFALLSEASLHHKSADRYFEAARPRYLLTLTWATHPVT